MSTPERHEELRRNALEAVRSGLAGLGALGSIHHVDIVIRSDGGNLCHEGDWIKDLHRVIPPIDPGRAEVAVHLVVSLVRDEDGTTVYQAAVGGGRIHARGKDLDEVKRSIKAEVFKFLADATSTGSLSQTGPDEIRFVLHMPTG
jgi:hypothetical protein